MSGAGQEGFLCTLANDPPPPLPKEVNGALGGSCSWFW